MIFLNVLLLLAFTLIAFDLDKLYLMVSVGFLLYNFPYFIEGFAGPSEFSMDFFYFVFLSSLLAGVTFIRIVDPFKSSIQRQYYRFSLKLMSCRYENINFLAVIVFIFTFRLAIEGFDGLLLGRVSGLTPGSGKSLVLILITAFSWTINAVFFVYSILTKYKKGLIISTLLLTINFVGGDRTYPALAILSLIAYIIHESRLVLVKFTYSLKDFKNISLSLLLVLMLVTVGFLGKQIYMALGISILSLDFSQLLSSLSVIELNIKDSEPYHIFYIISMTISSNFTIEPALMFQGFWASAVPFSNFLFDFDSNYFPEIVKEKFFTSWGVGTSPGASYIAQFYSAFGYLGIVIASFNIIALSFFIVSLIKRSSSKLNIAFLYISLSYVTFYVYRNSSEQIIVQLKKTIICWIAALIAIRIAGSLSSSIKHVAK